MTSKRPGIKCNISRSQGNCIKKCCWLIIGCGGHCILGPARCRGDWQSADTWHTETQAVLLYLRGWAKICGSWKIQTFPGFLSSPSAHWSLEMKRNKCVILFLFIVPTPAGNLWNFEYSKNCTWELLIRVFCSCSWRFMIFSGLLSLLLGLTRVLGEGGAGLSGNPGELLRSGEDFPFMSPWWNPKFSFLLAAWTGPSTEGESCSRIERRKKI